MEGFLLNFDARRLRKPISVPMYKITSNSYENSNMNTTRLTTHPQLATNALSVSVFNKSVGKLIKRRDIATHGHLIIFKFSLQRCGIDTHSTCNYFNVFQFIST